MALTEMLNSDQQCLHQSQRKENGEEHDEESAVDGMLESQDEHNDGAREEDGSGGRVSGREPGECDEMTAENAGEDNNENEYDTRHAGTDMSISAAPRDNDMPTGSRASNPRFYGKRAYILTSAPIAIEAEQCSSWTRSKYGARRAYFWHVAPSRSSAHITDSAAAPEAAFAATKKAKV